MSSGERRHAMKKDGFFAEALRAIVAQHKKNVREKDPNLFLNQKKQLWYAMMYAVDKEEDERQAQEGKDGAAQG